MKKKLIIEFVKMHGAGNDFIMIDNRFLYLSEVELTQIANKYCPRHFGVGADGLIALSRPQSEEADFKMDYFNTDGSRGEMCGNGARCLVRFANDSGIKKEKMAFESDIGLCVGSIQTDDINVVQVTLPITQELELNYQLSDVHNHTFTSIHFAVVGVPHIVGLVKDLALQDLDAIGRSVRNDSSLPVGANVNFVQTDRERGKFNVRTYERGVEAETKACGTGAIAVAIVMNRLQPGFSSNPAHISMPGGELEVQLESEKQVRLSGPVQKIFRGTFEF